jgi:hypothetical protein
VGGLVWPRWTHVCPDQRLHLGRHEGPEHLAGPHADARIGRSPEPAEATPPVATSAACGVQARSAKESVPELAHRGVPEVVGGHYNFMRVATPTPLGEIRNLKSSCQTIWKRVGLVQRVQVDPVRTLCVRSPVRHRRAQRLGLWATRSSLRTRRRRTRATCRWRTGDCHRAGTNRTTSLPCKFFVG